MVERIPSHLRSAVALHKFFETLFPGMCCTVWTLCKLFPLEYLTHLLGEVYDVEIALDLAELDTLNNQRKAVGPNCPVCFIFTCIACWSWNFFLWNFCSGSRPFGAVSSFLWSNELSSISIYSDWQGHCLPWLDWRNCRRDIVMESIVPEAYCAWDVRFWELGCAELLRQSIDRIKHKGLEVLPVLELFLVYLHFIRFCCDLI